MNKCSVVVDKHNEVASVNIDCVFISRLVRMFHFISYGSFNLPCSNVLQVCFRYLNCYYEEVLVCYLVILRHYIDC